MAYCVQADLENALGGAKQLRQLADPDSTGTAVAALVEDYLESGAARVRSALEVKHEPEVLANLDAASLRLVRDLNKWISAHVAWLEGGHGQAVPDNVRDQAKWCDDQLGLVADGKRRLGRASGGRAAAINQPVGAVDHDPRGSATSVYGLRRAGFR